MKLDKEKLLSFGCMITGVLSIPFVCYWYVGMILAVMSIVLGLLVKQYASLNRLVIIGWVCAGIYVTFFIILILAMGSYYSMIHLHRG